MVCFPCLFPRLKKALRNPAGPTGTSTEESPATVAPGQVVYRGEISSHAFKFQELAVATKNFRDDCVIGEGGFGKVYKGIFERTGQVVAVKQLNLYGVQGREEYINEVMVLSYLQHANLINLVGYCADGDQRLLVYEYMPQGSLEDHLFDLKEGQQPLDWFTRMRIAYGAAQGLEYLHEKANPPVIFRDLKPSNILLDENFNPKLSDFGLARLGLLGDKTHISTLVMGTRGYYAPEYARTGHLKVQSDVYSFGVVILELISGRRAIDDAKPRHEKNLVDWAKPMLRDQNRYPELIDPLIENDYPSKGLNRAVAVAAMCLQEEVSARPQMADVVLALRPLTEPANETLSPASSSVPPLPNKMSIDEGPSTSGKEIIEE